MNKILIIAILFISVNSFAQIGQTKHDIKKEYNENTIVEKNGVLIITMETSVIVCYFDNDICNLFYIYPVGATFESIINYLNKTEKYTTLTKNKEWLFSYVDAKNMPCVGITKIGIDEKFGAYLYINKFER